MKVWLKRVLFSLVVVVIAAVVGIAIFLLTFDPNAYKNKLEEVVYNRYHRTLSINGDIELSLFPRIGLSVQDVSLSNRDSDDLFASIDSARFAVAIWPLLSNRLVVDHVAVSGFKAWIRRDENGHFNFDDLLGRERVAVRAHPSALVAGALVGADGAGKGAQQASVDEAMPDGAAPVAATEHGSSGFRFSPLSIAAAQEAVRRTDLQIDIAGLDLKNGEIHLYDTRTGALGRIEKLEVNTGRMTFNQAFDVALKGRLIGKHPEADAALSGQALVQFNPNEQKYSAQKLNLQISGKLGELTAKTAVLRGNVAYDNHADLLDVSNLEMQVQGDVEGPHPIAGLETSLTAPRLKVDRSRAELRVEKLAFRAKGKTPEQAFDIAFDAPSLSVSPEAAKGEPVQGTVKLTRPDSVLGVSLGMSGLGGDAANLTLKELKIEASLKEDQRLVQLNMTSPATWGVFRRAGGLSAMKGDIRINDTALPGGSFEFPFIGSLQADLVKDKLASEIDAVLSGSKLNFRLDATQLQDPKIKFALTADKLDFNTMFPVPPAKPAAEGKPAAKEGGAEKQAPAKAEPRSSAAGSDTLDMAFLDSVDLSGTFKIGELKAQSLQASDVSADLRASDGRMAVNNLHASLYGGTLVGRLTADSKNALGAALTLSGVDVGSLLHDYGREDRLRGKGTIKVDVRSQGSTSAALEAGLTGSVQLRVRDGAVRGIDLLRTLGEVNEAVRNVFSGQLPGIANQIDMGRQTDFTSLDADVDLERGQATISRLNMAAPLLRVTQGKPATVDLVNDQMDLMVNVRLVGTTKGQSERNLANLRGVTIPLRISGPTNAPSFRVQWDSINSKEIEQAVSEGLVDMLSNQASQKSRKSDKPAATPHADPVKSIGEAIKGLLGQ